MGEQATEEPRGAAPTSAEPGEGAAASAAVGARVTALLAAAEEAAEQIRSAARAERDALLREPEDRAQARVEELTGEPERLRAEAEQDAAATRVEARADADRIVEEADERARATVGAAQREAAALRDSAQGAAQEIERQGLQRQRELRDELKIMEEGRQRALNSLQGSVNELRRVVSDVEGIIGAVNDLEARTTPLAWERPRRAKGLPWRAVRLGERDVADAAPATRDGADGAEAGSLVEALEDALEQAGGVRHGAEAPAGGDAGQEQ